MGLKELRGIAKREYPEIDKYAAADLEMQEILAFLDWLWEAKKYELARWRPSGNVMLPIIENREALLAEYFQIDTVKLENERRAMLAAAGRQDG